MYVGQWADRWDGDNAKCHTRLFPRAPRRPDAAEDDGLRPGHEVRTLRRGTALFARITLDAPLVPSIGGNQASASGEGLTKRPGPRDRLGPGIDHARRAPGIARPGRQEPPSRDLQYRAAVSHPHDRRRIRRGHVVVGNKIALSEILDLEQRGQFRRAASRRIPPTHAPDRTPAPAPYPAARKDSLLTSGAQEGLLPDTGCGAGRGTGGPNGHRGRQNGHVPDTHAVTGWPAPTATGPVHASVTLPGSKSMTARALVLAALADAPGEVRRPLHARDTTLMASGLRALGVQIATDDPARWVVTPARLRGPASIDVGLAGTVMRFLPPVAALAEGRVTFDGDPHARSRPLAPLVRALADLGVTVTAAPTGGLPLTVEGSGEVAGGEVIIDASASSQFVSALLLAAPAFRRGLVVRHEGPPVPSAPHLRMTVAMLRDGGAEVDDSIPDLWSVAPGKLAGRGWDIEPDLSGAAPFLAAAMVTGGEVTVPGWPRVTTQPGDQLRDLLTEMGAQVTVTDAGLSIQGTGMIRGIEADLADVSELTPVLAALAALGDRSSRLRGIAHIRGHETDRVAALATELSRLGAEVTEWPDGLEIRPRPLRGARFATYADHRMAHAAAVLGLVVPGVVLDDVACTSKTMPQFPTLWQDLAAGGSAGMEFVAGAAV